MRISDWSSDVCSSDLPPPRRPPRPPARRAPAREPLPRKKPWPRRSSEPRQIGERQLSAADVHTAELGAAVKLRKHLAGIQQGIVIESALHALLLLQVGLAEHRSHKIPLLAADAIPEMGRA